MTPVLWLTGAPGIGKTTVIQRVAEALPNQNLDDRFRGESSHSNDSKRIGAKDRNRS